MYAKSITFEDFNGNIQTETHYFNLSKAEVIKMELTADGNSFHDNLMEIATSGNGRRIMEVFDQVIEASYGIKSEDGTRFLKSKAIWEDFKASAAFDVFFTELLTKEGAAIEFANAVFPQDLAQVAEQEAGMPKQPQDYLKKQPRELRTQQDLELPEPEKTPEQIREEEINRIVEQRLEAMKDSQRTTSRPPHESGFGFEARD